MAAKAYFLRRALLLFILNYSQQDSLTIPIVAGVVVGLGLCLAVVFAAWCIKKRRAPPSEVVLSQSVLHAGIPEPAARSNVEVTGEGGVAGAGGEEQGPATSSAIASSKFAMVDVPSGSGEF